MRFWLSAVWGLLFLCAIATGILLYAFYIQSSTVQLSKTESEVERACRDVEDRYRFYVAGWRGTANLADPALREGLTAVLTSALLKNHGVEGGIWSADRGSLAYAFPTYEGTGPKTDLPAAELPTIRDTNMAALDLGRQKMTEIAGSSQTLVLSACVLSGPLPKLTAWTMARAFTGRGPAYNQLLAGLAMLAFLVVVSAAMLGRTIFAYTRRTKSIEAALGRSDDLADLAPLPPTGERELDRIVSALNSASLRLADARYRVVNAERLAAIGSIAAGVAHEVRNPMAAMRLKAENALVSGLPDRAADALRMVVAQTDRLDALLKDLLGLASVRGPTLEPTDAFKVVREAVDLHCELAAASSVRIDLMSEIDEGFVLIDKSQFHGAVSNLLLNAIAAASQAEDRTVRVLVQRDHRDGVDMLIVRVSDHGPGVAESERSAIFEPFHTTRLDGHGLGLAIVSEVARAHNGQIHLLPSAQGAVFELMVPWRTS